MKIIKNNAILLGFFLMNILGIYAQDNYQKTGYFTRVYAREHSLDMPREFFLLIEADGTMITLSFHEHRSTGAYSIWNFDPKDFLGKTITIDFDATVDNQNNEFTFFEGGNLILIPKLRVIIINSFVESGSTISSPEKYRHPVTDTIQIPHDILIPEEIYADKTPTKVVQLSNYVSGNGTENSPYTSADGTAGLKTAIENLPNGGTIKVPSGEYLATSRNLTIPRFVSIKGIGETQPNFYLNTDRMWYLKGSNTIDNISVDVTKNTRDYTHEVIIIDNNARDVTIKDSKFISNYQVEAETFNESGQTVIFRLYSHLKNITFQDNLFISPLRPIAIKGQRNVHNLTFKGNRFESQCHMCITLDQVSNISNVVIEDNEFIEFSHFGVALARVNDVKIRNNTFYSRNLLSFNTYNQALHIEEHTQNVVIENNTIDVTLRNSGTGDPNSSVRSFGMIISDSRFLTVKNNNIKHSDIHFGSGGTPNTSGYSKVVDNRLEDGSIDLKDGNVKIQIENNDIINPPDHAISFNSVKPMLYPYGWHTITNNRIIDLDDKQPFNLKGVMYNVSFNNNVFQGCNLTKSSFDLYTNSTNIDLTGNRFVGISSSNAFDLVKDLPSSNSLSAYISNNTFTENCSALGINKIENKLFKSIYPNPVKSGELVYLKNLDDQIRYSIYDTKGAFIKKGRGNKLNTKGLKPNVYLIRIFQENSSFFSKLMIH